MAPIKLVILRDNLSYLMGEVTELDEEPSYLITGCMKIDGDKVSAFPEYTDQRDVFLTSDTIMSILDPSPNLVELYNSK